MATSTDEEVIEYEDYIDQQIARTSFHLKTVDLVSGLILLTLVVLASLLAIVIVDHWIVGLGFRARLAALIGVLSVSLVVLITRVLLPVMRSINPEYAAQTVEKSHPSLKNSVINFLFFRDRPDSVRPAVFQGMQQQAATGLADVPIDSAVDRGSIIHWGYVLVAITAVWVAYIFLSPKNSLQTLQRVASPWEEIARPSEVDILAVTPGDADIFRGQTIDVKTEIGGLKEGQVPAIEYSTLDGQSVDQRVQLVSAGVAGHFNGTLSTSDSGIHQDLEYRIVAGDAVSRAYSVSVSEAPHITVDRIEYSYPSYTGLTAEVVQGEGRIRAIEGTRVTIYGKANQPIRRGHIEFMPATDESNPNADVASKQAPLNVTDSEGRVRFALRMGADRKQSIYRAYRLHFRNENDVASVDPIEHPIEVTPDLRPVVQILSPEKRTIEVPINGWQKIEVRAVDPDFKLTKVQLSARTRGRLLLKQGLLTESQEGQFTATVNFVPADHGLKPGDVVTYVAVAEDNRHSSLQNQPEPNLTESNEQYLRIVEADPMANEAPDEGGKQPPNAGDEPPENEDQQNGNKNKKEQQGNKEKQDPSNQGEGEQQPGEQQAGDQQPGEQRQSDSDSEGGEPEQQEGSDGGDSGLKQDGNQGGKSRPEDLESGAAGESQDDSQSQSRQGSGGDQESDGGGDQSQPNDNSSDGGGDSESNSDPQDGDPNRNGEGGKGAENDDRGTPENEPLPSTGERDGEVVERIKEHMKEKGRLDPSLDKTGDPQDSQTSDGPNGSDSDSSDSPSSEPNEQRDSEPKSDPNSEIESEPGNGENGSEAETESGDKPDQPNRDPDGARESSPDDQSKQPNNDRPNNDRPNNDQTRTPPGEGDPSPQSGDPNEQSQSGDNEGQGESSQNGKQGGSDSGQNSDGKASEQNDARGQEPPPGDSGEDAGENDSENASEKSGDESGQPSGSESESGQPGESESGDQGDGQDSQNGDPSQGKTGDKGKPQSGDNENSSQNQDSNANPENGDPKDGDPKSGNSGDSSSKKPKGQPGGKPDGKSDKSNSSSDGQGDPAAARGDKGNATDSGQGNADGDVGGDDANLEYSKKATDLVLDYLRDQKERPDQELLDKLGWNQDDMNQFLRRWDEMKQRAAGDGSEAKRKKRELDDVLRGMGLRPPNQGIRKAGKSVDAQKNNRNSGRKTKVPVDLLDPFRAFQRSQRQTE